MRALLFFSTPLPRCLGIPLADTLLSSPPPLAHDSPRRRTRRRKPVCELPPRRSSSSRPSASSRISLLLFYPPSLNPNPVQFSLSFSSMLFHFIPSKPSLSYPSFATPLHHALFPFFSGAHPHLVVLPPTFTYLPSNIFALSPNPNPYHIVCSSREPQDDRGSTSRATIGVQSLARAKTKT